MTQMREITLNGKWPLILPEHRAARAEWTTPPYWEAERLNSMAEHITPGMTVWDIGTEEGDITALCALWAGDMGGVVAFEPNPRVWPNIRAIFQANNLNLEGYFVGFAGDKNRPALDAGPMRRMEDGWPYCSHGDVIGDHGFCNLWERPDIPAVTIDDAATQFPYPNAITIDVEGSEFRVLKGAASILETQRPLVWCSVHPDFMLDMYSDTPELLYSYMNSLDYKYEVIARDHEVHVFFQPT